MPAQDGTGPTGAGPRTGRGFGQCSILNRNMGFGGRKGIGMGRGLGRYFGCPRWPQTKEEQLKALSEYKKAIKEELEDIETEEKELDKV